jgi:hypothetical protein
MKHFIMHIAALMILFSGSCIAQGRPLVIRITNSQTGARNEDSQVIVPVYLTYLDYQGATNVPLHDFSHMTNDTCTSLDIRMQGIDDEYHNLPLPENISQRLLEYLNYGPSSKPFDCASFVHFIHKRPYLYGSYDENKWDCADFDSPRDLSPGTAVIVWKETDGQPPEAVHFGLYLGNAVFLWKFGPRIGLFVSDLDSMQEAFGGTKTQILKKK